MLPFTAAQILLAWDSKLAASSVSNCESLLDDYRQMLHKLAPFTEGCCNVLRASWSGHLFANILLCLTSITSSRSLSSSFLFGIQQHISEEFHLPKPILVFKCLLILKKPSFSKKFSRRAYGFMMVPQIITDFQVSLSHL